MSSALINSEAHTRVMGVLVAPISGAMIWAGMPQSTTLETVLFVLGMFFLLLALQSLGLLLLMEIIIVYLTNHLFLQHKFSLIGMHLVVLLLLF